MKRLTIPILLTMTVFMSGCATIPYEFGQNIEVDKTYRLREGEPQFERGRPNGFLDAADWYWPGSLLSKLILWNRKVDSHQVSEETETALRDYLTRNDLHNVKVRINQYSPAREWRRTFRNNSVGAGWRYTLGFLGWLGYTAMPGRFFGGDNYNPYSNTINIYSDHPGIAIHEGGHSKDFAKKTLKGSYAALYMLPGVALYHEAQASSDALGYLRAEACLQDQKDAYKILYPAYGTYIGGTAADFVTWPYNYAVYAAGVIPGHIIGRIRAYTLPEEEHLPTTEKVPDSLQSNGDGLECLPQNRKLRRNDQ